jgi:hypothetical protein
MAALAQKASLAPPDVARRAHHLQTLLDRLEAAEAAIHGLAESTEEAADRFMGSEPQSPETRQTEPQPSGLFHQLDHQIGKVERAIERLRSQVVRLA